jgi:hypothetical protein
VKFNNLLVVVCVFYVVKFLVFGQGTLFCSHR